MASSAKYFRGVESSWINQVAADSDGNVHVETKNGSTYTTPVGSEGQAVDTWEDLAEAGSVGSAVNEFWKRRR